MRHQKSWNGSGILKSIFQENNLIVSGFIEDNPGGTLSKGKMMEMYQAVLSENKARVFVDQIFTKFDTDNSGEIDFKVCYIFN